MEQDQVFRDLLSFKPAMQLCYDVFGPLFHLGQVSNRHTTASNRRALMTHTSACQKHDNAIFGFCEQLELFAAYGTGLEQGPVWSAAHVQ